MTLDDALQLFLRRVEVIVSMEMGDKIPTKEAYKEIKDEVRKLKKLKKLIHHEEVATAAALASTNIVQLDWDEKFL